MQGFPKISAVIMVVGFVVSVAVSMRMQTERLSIYKNKEREKRVYAPVAGIEKFWADITWLRCIHQLGRAKKAMNATMVRYFDGQFNMISNLDPDFMPVYKIGVSSIAYPDLDKALAIIGKGKKYANEQDWYLPYQAAHWVLQIRARPEKDMAKKKEYYETAIKYLEEAISIGGVPWYVENMLLHTRAKRDDKYGKPLPELEAWYDYYRDRLQKARAAMAEPEQDPKAKGPKGEKPPAGVEGEMPPEAFDAESDTVLTRLRERIRNRCLSLMRTLIAEKNEADQKKVRAIFKGVNPTGHYAPRSLVSYDAGDLFDRATGDPVTPYGIDLYDFEVNGRITPLKGDYNTLTGKKVARTFKDLEAMLGNKRVSRLADHHPDKTGQSEK